MKIHRYPLIDNKSTIQLKLIHLSALYDHKDPSPPRLKDLDSSVASYIFESFQEIEKKDSAQIQIIFQKSPNQEEKFELAREAIHQYFSFEAASLDKRIRHIFREGRKALFIGLFFLGFATIMMHSFSFKISEPLQAFFKEGVTLTGWVAMWRPINVFLYEWWPVSDKKKLCQKLSTIPIVFQTTDLLKGAFHSK